MPPVVAAVVSTVISVGTAVLSSVIGQALVSFAVSFALTALAPKPNLGAQVGGHSLNLTTDPATPWQFIVGRAGLGGSLTYWQLSASEQAKLKGVDEEKGRPPNGKLQLVITLADNKVEKLSRAWANEGPITVPSTSGVRTTVPQYRHGGDDHMWITFYNGDHNQTADGNLISNSGGKWTANHRLRGHAYVIVEMDYNAEVYSNGLPKFLWELEGGYLYDRRYDTTAGGDGPQRANNPSSWTISQNPQVLIDNYIMGWRVNDYLWMGMGASLNRRPYETFEAEANVCDETVSTTIENNTEANNPSTAYPYRFPGATYGSQYDYLPEWDGDWPWPNVSNPVNAATTLTQPRYEVSGIIDSSISHKQMLKDILTSCAGTFVENGGRLLSLSEYARTPVMVLNDSDTIVGQPIQSARKKSSHDLVNMVEGRYSAPHELYRATAYPRLFSIESFDEDGGGEHPVTIDFPFEKDRIRVQRLAKIHLAKLRRQYTCAMTVRMKYCVLEAGDVIEVNSLRRGWTEKQFIILDRVINRNLNVTLIMIETDPSDNAWDPNEAGANSSLPVASLGLPSLQLGNVTVVAINVDSADGNVSLPALLVSWDEVDTTYVDRIEIRYRVSGSTDPWITQYAEASMTSITIVEGILPNTAYEVEVVPISDGRRGATGEGSASTGPTYRVASAATFGMYDETAFDNLILGLNTSIADAQQDIVANAQVASDAVAGVQQQVTANAQAASDGIAAVAADLVDAETSFNTGLNNVTSILNTTRDELLADIDVLETGVQNLETITDEHVSQIRTLGVVSNTLDLVPNGAFGSGTVDGWYRVQDNFSVPASALPDIYSFVDSFDNKFSVIRVHQEGTRRNLYSELIDIDENKSYKLRACIRNVGNDAQYYVGLVYFDETGPAFLRYPAASNVTITDAQGWVELESGIISSGGTNTNHMIPAGVVRAQVLVFCNYGAASGVVSYVDNVSFEEKSDFVELTSRLDIVDSVNSDQATRLINVETLSDTTAASVTSLQTTTTDQATDITNLQFADTTHTTNINTALTATSNNATAILNLETTTDSLSSTLSTLQTTTDSTATDLTILTTRVDDTETNITNLLTTTAETASLVTDISVIAASEGLTPNGSFSSGSLDGWYRTQTRTADLSTNDYMFEETFQGEDNLVRVPHTSNRRNLYSGLIPLDTTKSYQLISKIYSESTVGTQFYTGVRYYDLNGATIGGLQYSGFWNTTLTQTDGWVENISDFITGTSVNGTRFTMPESAVYIQVLAFMDFGGTADGDSHLAHLYLRDATVDAASESRFVSIEDVNASQAQSIISLTTTSDNNSSEITTLNTTTANHATTLSSLSTTSSSHTSSIDTLNTTTSTNTTNINTLTTTSDSHSTSINNLNTTTSNNATSINTLTTTSDNHSTSINNLATTTNTHATTLSTLTTTTDNHTSYINTLTSTTDSHATTLSSLSTTSGNHTSSINNLNSTTSNHSTSINNLTTTSDNHSTSISNLNTTTSTHATNLSTLNTTVGSHTASINSLNTTTAGHASSITTLEGTISQTIAFNVTGGQLGLQYVNGGGTTARIAADSIILDGSIQSAHIGNLAVDTLHIAGNAITAREFATQAAAMDISFSHAGSASVAGTNILAQSITTTGGDVYIDVDAWLSTRVHGDVGGSSDNIARAIGQIKIYRNGILRATRVWGQYILDGDNTANERSDILEVANMALFRDQPPAGTHTYQVYAHVYRVTSSATVSGFVPRVRDRSMRLTEYKR